MTGHINCLILPCMHAKSLQSCPTVCGLMDYSLAGSFVHGILQARILEWVAISSSRGSSWPRNWTWVSCCSGTAGGFYTTEPSGKPHTYIFNNDCDVFNSHTFLSPTVTVKMENSVQIWTIYIFFEKCPSTIIVSRVEICMLNWMSPEIQPWVPGVFRQKSLWPRFAWWLYSSQRCENLGILSSYLGLSFLLSKIRLFKFSKFPSCWVFFLSAWETEMPVKCVLELAAKTWPSSLLCVSPAGASAEPTHWKHNSERRWKKGDQWFWRMRNPKEKQGNGRGAVCQGMWG